MKGMQLMSRHAFESMLYTLLKKPIITEKATNLTAKGQYVMEVSRTATKDLLAQAFELAFPGRKVTGVRVISVRPRKKRYGKRTGETSERKKAIFSIEGSPIEFLTGV